MNMEYYNKDYLKHGDRTWKKHKYIRKVKGANGNMRYIYDNLGLPDTGNGHHANATFGSTAIDAARKSYEMNKANYEDSKKPDAIQFAKGSYGYDSKKHMVTDAKNLRELKEETPKAKLGKAILKIHNIETILKTKIKDIFK